MEDDQAGNISPPPRTAPPHGRYGSVAILLHWAIAAAFAVQIGLGWQMGDPRGPRTFAAFQLHKSIGITILLLTLVRIGWRLTHAAPPLSPSLRPVERLLARAVHAGFYVLLLAMPLSGWLIVSTSSTGIPTVLFGTIPWPHLPVPAALRGSVGDSAGTAHGLLAWIALAMIALHVLGALKHQLFDRDDELGRMVPAPRTALPWLAILLPAGLVGLMALGRTVSLAAPAAPETAPAAAPAVVATAVVEPVAAPTATAAVVPTPTPTPQASAAAAATTTAPSAWTVRPHGKRIGFRTAWSQGQVDGRFGTWSAGIVFGPDALDRSSVTVTIDLASVTTAAGDQQSALPGDDWFAVNLHPQAIFRATRFRHLGGDRYRADGMLTLRGRTRPQPVDFTLRIAGDVATVSGTARIDRSAFGVGQGEWASTADLPADVQLSFALTADRKASATPR